MPDVAQKWKGTKHLLLALFVVLLWVFVGTFFYWGIQNCTQASYDACPEETPSVTCGWSFAQSFYYSVQTGLSIGFGLLSEDKDGSRLYSVFHILMGSSFIAGALALFASVALERQSSWQTKQEEELARFSASIHENGYKGLSADEVVELMLQSHQYLRDVYMSLESDNSLVIKKMELFEKANAYEQRKICIEVMQEAHEKIDDFKDGRVTIDELRALHADHRSPWRRFRNWAYNNQGKVTTNVAFFLWVTLGVVYGVAVEKWSFIQSLYFSVAALSTAGLQAVTPCNDGFNVVFTGLYALIGVPIFGMTLGSYANVLVDLYNQAKFKEQTKRRVTRAETEFVEHLLDREHSDSVDLSEFIEIQLLRLGKVDRSDLESIKDRFNKLDVHKKGRISKEDFLRDRQRKAKLLKEQQNKGPGQEPSATDKKQGQAEATI